MTFLLTGGKWSPFLFLSLVKLWIYKTMESVINCRLEEYLKSDKLLNNVQCGFRSRQRRVDYFIRFEMFCREAFHNQHNQWFLIWRKLMTLWKYRIMKDLHGFGLWSQLTNFINNFLKVISFKVWMGSTFSDPHPQERGIHQSSILSVALFSIKITIITECLKPVMDCLLYVDDFQTCMVTWVSSNVSCSFFWINFSNKQLTIVLHSVRQSVCICTRSWFKLTVISWQESDSSGGGNISDGYIWHDLILSNSSKMLETRA